MEARAIVEGTISPWGNGRAIRIPKDILEIVGLKDNDKIRISTNGNQIVIEATKKYRSLKDRVEDFYKMDFDTAIAENPYTFDEVDFGCAVGDEVW